MELGLFLFCCAIWYVILLYFPPKISNIQNLPHEFRVIPSPFLQQPALPEGNVIYEQIPYVFFHCLFQLEL